MSDDPTPVKCECGNAIEAVEAAQGETKCDHCSFADHLREIQQWPHDFSARWMHGARICARCNLLPLDGHDTWSDCPEHPDYVEPVED